MINSIMIYMVNIDKHSASTHYNYDVKEVDNWSVGQYSNFLQAIASITTGNGWSLWLQDHWQNWLLIRFSMSGDPRTEI